MARDRNEPVRLTRIYTRGGDKGETSLGDGSRVAKLDVRIRAYGLVDELNSLVGVALTAPNLPAEVLPVLERVQNELFDVGADLSVPWAGPDERLRVTQAMIDRLEALCDAARIHVARAVCRRAELAALEAGTVEQLNPLAPVYLNRLSDLLFILAREANHLVGHAEPLWRPGA